MATVKYIERNGTRTDLEPGEIKTEKHCDQCGLFIPAAHAVLALVQIKLADQDQKTALGDVHVACLDTWMMAKATQYQREQMS